METIDIQQAPNTTLDRIGIVASCACAVHCAVMPALLGVLPLLGLGVLADERTEWTLIAVSFLIGAASLLPSYFRHHRRATPLLLFAAGLTFIVAGRIVFEDSVRLETSCVVCGALLIASSHFVNRRLCQACCVRA